MAKDIANTHDLRSDSDQELRHNRVERALHFDISQDDDVSMTTSSGVQAEAQTSSSGVQAEAQTRSSGTQPSTRMKESEMQTGRINNKRTRKPSD